MHPRMRLLVVCLLFFYAARVSGEETISTFLTHMPQNSDKRCIGIAGVAEALIKGKQGDDLAPSSVDALADQIYQNFTSGKSIHYPAQLTLADKKVAIDDMLALQELSRRVADLYKADYCHLRRTPAGIKRLFAAEEQPVKTRAELTRLLQGEPEKIMFFCCFGMRVFPDGKVSETSHAVLIQAMPHEDFIVYDPNDPGRPAVCSLEEKFTGLWMSWKCKYRDQEIETEQGYHVVPSTRYFSALQ